MEKIHPWRLNGEKRLGTDDEFCSEFFASGIFGGYLCEAAQQPVGCYRLMLGETKAEIPRVDQII